MQNAVPCKEIDGRGHADGHFRQRLLVAFEHDAVERPALAEVHQFVVVPLAGAGGILPLSVADNVHQQSAALELFDFLQDGVVGPVVGVVVIKFERILLSGTAHGEDDGFA